MDKIYKKIEAYLKENFPKKELVKVNNLSVEGKNVEVYGFNSILILVKEADGKVYFNPVFKKSLSI
jgi:hypothetical protein